LSAGLQGAKMLDFAWAKRESAAGHQLDQKQFLSSSSLYLFNSTVYNYAEAGNVVWGAAMANMGFGYGIILGGAEWYALTTQHKFDQPWEVKAFTTGWLNNGND
jgi:hypothetical protein